MYVVAKHSFCFLAMLQILPHFAFVLKFAPLLTHWKKAVLNVSMICWPIEEIY